MELHQLRSFIEVAQEGSFTRAAEKLYLTQPALSLQIKALETELGAPLFERRNRQIFLTEVGRMVLQRAKEQLENLGDPLKTMAGSMLAPLEAELARVQRQLGRS